MFNQSHLAQPMIMMGIKVTTCWRIFFETQKTRRGILNPLADAGQMSAAAPIVSQRKHFLLFTRGGSAFEIKMFTRHQQKNLGGYRQGLFFSHAGEENAFMNFAPGFPTHFLSEMLLLSCQWSSLCNKNESEMWSMTK